MKERDRGRVGRRMTLAQRRVLLERIRAEVESVEEDITAAEAQRHLRYRTHVAAQVSRLARLLEEWEAWDVDQLLPPAERRRQQPPLGGRDALSVLHRALLDELHDLDGPPEPAAPSSEPANTAWRSGAAQGPTDAAG